MDNPHACLQCNRYLHRIRELEAAIRWALDSGDVFYPKDVGDRLRDALAGLPRPPVYGLNCGVDLRTGKGICVCGRCSPLSDETLDRTGEP